MQIDSLNYLKKVMHKGVRFEVVAHHEPEMVGTCCVVSMRTWHGIHSVACDDLGKAVPGREHERITIWWYWSANWVFADGLCTLYNSEEHHTEDRLIASIRVLA